jgi:hypothetical protein
VVVESNKVTQGLIRRPKPYPAELLVIAWLLFCFINVIQAFRHRPYFVAPLNENWIVAYLWAPIIAGVWGIARQKRWRAMLVCLCIVAFTGIASGNIQLISCPHARYLQVTSFYIPVWGDPCSNSQDSKLRPWWIPET